jgi:hypothetical protein
MWFTWSSGATGPCGACSSPLATFRTDCRSSKSAVPMLALARRDMVRSTCPHSAGTACAGKIRSILRLPGRSPPPSVTLEHVAALRSSRTRPLRTLDRSVRQHFRPGSPDPPDLGAYSPDAHRSLRPGREAGFPLLGLSKDRPFIVQASESDSRSHPAQLSLRPALPSGWESRFPSACRPRGFSPPRRFVPPRPCDHFQAAADPGVHRVSLRRETEFPAMFLLPFEAFPPPTATALRTNSEAPWARVTAATVSGRCVHREPCLLALFLPSLRDHSFLRPFARQPGPRGLSPSSGPLRVRPFPAERTRCSLGLG